MALAELRGVVEPISSNGRGTHLAPAFTGQVNVRTVVDGPLDPSDASLPTRGRQPSSLWSISMDYRGDPISSSGLLTPETVIDQLPSRPVLSSVTGGRQGLVLQRYRHPPSVIVIPGLSDALLVAHLRGPVLVEESLQGGGVDRQWTGPGQVTVTPAGQPIRRVLKGRSDVALLFFQPEFLRKIALEAYGADADRLTLVACLGAPDEAAERLVGLLLAEAERPGTGSVLMVQSLTQALALHLLRSHSNRTPSLPTPPPSLPSSRLRRVIEQMQASLEGNLPLSELAETSGLSQSQFVRAFRGATGQPPHRYLVELRVERARALLEQTDMPITSIGVRCGFEQPSHFSTTFRARTGFSPRAWRQARHA